ncbi:MAG: PepSY domain-containing protein [Gammaproteobacteria bacterium]|nr:PepSY domain-containing protein [Gammaproteobacteria bacterium]
MSKRKHNNRTHKKGRLLPFIIFHRWIGLSSLLLLILVSITGILLNHTEEFSLDEQYINNNWLQKWYGIKMPEQQKIIKLDNDHFAQIGKQIYFNQLRIAEDNAPLRGVYKTNDFNVIILRDSLYLLTFDGDLIEKINSENGLPTPISHAGFSDSKNKQIILEIKKKLYTTKDNFISWSEAKTEIISPLILGKPDNDVKENYRNAYLGNELSLERVILDLHSGRLFGSLGIYLMDFAAIILIMLGLSGTWIWSRRFRKKY